MTSLYRRHRPQTFDEVVGQAPIVRTMRNAVEQGKVHHAYLFVGSRGTGKTSIAKILARSLNCVNGPTLEPCGECESCRAISAGTSLDVIEMDAASNNSVDDIRDLREKVGFAPAMGRWKVYILDEAHMLSTSAWNAFLKTLEEPPPNTIFVLATTEAHKVLPTIVDRCHRFDFRRPSLPEITTVLQRIADAEGIEADERALAMIARAAGGSFRDAIGTLDQLVTYGDRKVTLEGVLEVLDVADADLIFGATDAIVEHDPGAALERVQELADSGRDPVQFMRDLTAHLRQLVVVQTLGEAPDSFSVTADQTARLEAQAHALPQSEAVRAIGLVAEALAAVKEGSDARIQLEVALLKAARPRSDASVEALLMRIEQLERSLGGEPAPVADISKRPKKKDTPPPKTEQEAAPVVGIDTLWPAVLERVQESEGGEMLAALLADARPSALAEDELVLEYPQSASFSKRKIADPANADRLAEALRLVAGRPVSVRVELRERDDEDDEVKAARMDSGLSEDQAIERIKDTFDAEDLSETETEPEPEGAR
ncbi:MAG: DNA polymerase III subunit gamma/tau [Candidatus Rokuibacteriota bacterium]|nr:MAG: DNA polymerase III subunit gamma/tau [Candidatus Rokubacteria bacterium]